MKANRLMKKSLAHLLPVVMIVAVMMAGLVLFGPMMAEKAHADTAAPTSITQLDPQFEDGKISAAHEVTFAGKKWLVLGYDGVGDPYSEGATKITLLAKDCLLTNAYFSSDQYNNEYSSSILKIQLENYVANTTNFTPAEQAAIITRTLEGGSNVADKAVDYVSGDSVDAKLWPLSSSEANMLSLGIVALESEYWLRSPGYKANYFEYYTAAYVWSASNTNYHGVNASGYKVSSHAIGVRPALQLDLDLIECTFDDEEIKITPQGPVKSVSLDPETSTITVGEILTLTPTAVFNDTSDQTLIWDKMGTGIKLYTDAACTNELVLEKPVSNTPVYAQGVSVFQTNCVFVSANANRGKCATCTINVRKGDPVTPTGLTAVCGQTLTDVALPNGWSWADSTTNVGNAGEKTFKANFTSADQNYNDRSNIDVPVTVVTVYNAYLPTGAEKDAELEVKKVTFNGKKWYITEDNATNNNTGTLTLLAEQPMAASKFNETSSSNAYKDSTVQGVLDTMTGESGAFYGISPAIRSVDLTDVGVEGAKLYLLSYDEAYAVPQNVRTCLAAAGTSNTQWWLRTAHSEGQAKDVIGYNGDLTDQHAGSVTDIYGVRPALRLDLSRVSFSSDTRTFLYDDPVNSVSVTPGSIDANQGGVYALTPTVSFNDPADQTVKWSVTAGSDKVRLFSDEGCSSAITLDSAMAIDTVYVRAEHAGEATVQVTTNADAKIVAECNVQISKKDQLVTSPTAATDLVYTGEAHSLLVSPPQVISGNTAAGNIEYSLDSGKSWSTDLPQGTDAGDYHVYYKVLGTNDHNACSGGPIEVSIAKATEKVAVPSGKSLTYNARSQTGVASGASYTISGTASAVNAGSYEATATLKTDDNITYTWSDGTTDPKRVNWQINRAGNSLSVSGKTATIKAKKVKKKNQKLAIGKVISFRNGGQGARAYAKLSGNKKITVNKTTGQVAVKKKLKKGTYKVKVKVMAAGDPNYNASAWKQVTFKIKVK